MESQGSVLLTFLIYSTAMFTIPLFTFFAVKNLLEKEFNINGFMSTTWSVISAVVVVNIIIMSYAWRAFKREIEEEVNSKSISSSSDKYCIEDTEDFDFKKRN